MKKKYVVIFSVLIIVSVLIYICIPKEKEEVEDTETKANKNGFLTLMLEQDDGTYQKSTSNTWPGDGYAFNNELSGCERGGELVYDRETNIVKLISSGSDKCYVYFDKYNVAKITNVTSTKTTNSVTLTVTTQAGENPIDKYYFSKDDGNSYEESSTSSYTFSGLNDNTTYKFKVYAKDTLGYETNEESIEVTTNAYVNPTVNNVTVTDTTNDSISVSVSASGGTNNVATYYYSINNGSYTSSSSNTKTFTGLSKGTTYTIKVYVKDTNGVSSSEKTTSAETESLTYICTTGTNLATCIKNQYTSQGTNGLYYHTSSLENSASDNSYRYAGANPNNYVCFGSDASMCPSDNLYRIIGVFGNEVKLIKSTSYGDFAWDSGNDNTWSTSDIKNTLNSTYYNTLNATWQNKIATHTWKVGGMNGNNGYGNGAQTAYSYEVGSSSSSTTWSGKIGLMYVSDYYYGATNTYWTYPGYSYSGASYDYRAAAGSNWLPLGDYEWTISRNMVIAYYAFHIDVSNYVHGGIYVFKLEAVRPCFYLTSSTTYVSGSGTSSDPIRIN